MTSISNRQYQIMTSPCKRILTQGDFANELRERELTYINLIRDLYQENKYLREALDRETNKEDNSVDYNKRIRLEITPRVKQTNRRYELLQNQNFQPCYATRGAQNHILWNISQSINSQPQNTYFKVNEGFENTYPWDQLQKKMAEQETAGFTFMGALNNPLNNIQSQKNIQVKPSAKQARPIIILGDKENENKNFSVNASREKHGLSKNKTIGNSRSVIHLGGSTDRYMDSNNSTSRRHSPRYIDMSPTYGQGNTNNNTFKLNQHSQQELYRTGLVFYNPNSSNIHQIKRSNTIINSLNSPEANKQVVFYPTGSLASVHQVRRTESPPLIFNRNHTPIVQREVRHVVRSKPVLFANIPEIGKNAQSREYFVDPIYREINFNNSEAEPRLTEKSIRQEVVSNDRLKSLVNIPNQEQENPYNRKAAFKSEQGQNAQNLSGKANQNINYLKLLCENIESNTEKANKENSIRFNISENQQKQCARPFDKLEKEEKEEIGKNNQKQITVRVHSVDQGVKMSKLSQAALFKDMTSLQNFSKQTIPAKKKKNNLNISNRIYL